MWGFCNIFQNDGARGTFEEDLQRCILCGRRSTRDMFIWDVRRSGRWFHERGCILEHRIFRFAKKILHDRCSTSYNLASFCRGRCTILDRWSGKSQNALVRGQQLCTQLLHFWRKSRRIASFLMLSTLKIEDVSQIFFLTLSSSKIEDVSQNCFVFDVVKFKKWGSLAE